MVADKLVRVDPVGDLLGALLQLLHVPARACVRTDRDGEVGIAATSRAVPS